MSLADQFPPKSRWWYENPNTGDSGEVEVVKVRDDGLLTVRWNEGPPSERSRFVATPAFLSPPHRRSALNRERTCRCGQTFTSPDYRFCEACRKEILGEMERAKYLTEVPPKSWYRGPDKKQAYQGDPSPWQENAVRAMEDQP